ncbi:VPS10 domain-containing protein [Actinokineospora sp. UTMC 2448]|uniref:WD40/YVTN/BNR-like repeat-containing protein n=1 Tax=Actinokineospora sp. UTMC 2448 TaxID=2268449 RepID=UPI002164C808|nr:exo-alpha-sialidase [Actinokineospora sp. UTMC 2448]UVS79716.1 Xyloglucanase precursor [Actinokineospora sp. UTMC 2448]
MVKTPVWIVAATAVLAMAGASAVSTPETSGADAAERTADPVGAEEWMYLQRANPDGSIPDAAVTQAIAQSEQLGVAAAGTDQVWKQLGPGNIGGRIRDIATDPTTRGVVYIATGTGGLWRTDDGGATFDTAWDDRLPQSMGAVAVDSRGVVWAGTGEPDHGGGSAYYGKGVYKSTDGGATWTNVGLSSGDTVGQIVIDPRDDDRVFVAVMGALHDTEPTRGLFMTEDGGATWTRVIAPPSASTGVIDVTVNKTNPDIMLATTWDKVRDEKSRIYGKNSFLYRSTDGGRTWVNIHQAPLPQSVDVVGQPDSATYVGRMGVDFSDSDPNRAYLISSTAGGNFNGFFTSADAGATWTPVGATSGGTLQSISGGFAWWFGRVYVDPVDPLHVFVAGVSLAESLDGGLTWTTSRTPHADQHGLEWDPFTPGRVYLGNDGGFYWSTENGAARGLWAKTPYLPVTQFYAMDVSHQDGSRVNAGAQDNGSLKSWGSDNTVTGDWFGFVGGDGMMNRIDPTDDRKYYGCSQNGGCRGFVDGAGFSMTIPGARKNWVAPLEFSADPRILFGASEYVSRINTDAGQRTWQRISPDLTEGTEPRAPGFGTVTALGTTAADPNLVYAGTDSGLMWVSRNAMAADPAQVTWERLRSPVFPGRWVTRITVDPQNPRVAWASFSGWRSGDGYPHLVMTSDGGRTWADIAGKKIPQAPVNDVIRHPSKPRWLFIATDVGVYRTTNLGRTWTKVGTNLPLVPITDIDLPAGSDTLYAATYGRSIWTTSLAD